MTHNLTVDVKHSVESFYPGLSSDEVELLSKNIVDNWDYSHIYTTMLEDLQGYATFNKIDLKGKDGVETNSEEYYGFDVKANETVELTLHHASDSVRFDFYHQTETSESLLDVHIESILATNPDE